MTVLALSSVRFTRASEQDARTGLIGFVAFTIAGRLRVDGVVLRRTRDGRLVLSWPQHRDRHGVDHPVLRPTGDDARCELEAAIFEALGISAEGSHHGR